MRLVSDDPAFRKPDAEARAVTAVPDAQADTLGDLEFLDHHWGDAYVIGAEDPEYTALRRDGRGAKLTAPDRDGLADKIGADYNADPVSRDVP